ncbi:hypothetical protein HK104_009061 [Borealophlyctis nickersoniae]|nr:hypothetical protein HK104_009061 [Borealophlyctis nickersoniae]
MPAPPIHPLPHVQSPTLCDSMLPVKQPMNPQDATDNPADTCVRQLPVEGLDDVCGDDGGRFRGAAERGGGTGEAEGSVRREPVWNINTNTQEGIKIESDEIAGNDLEDLKASHPVATGLKALDAHITPILPPRKGSAPDNGTSGNKGGNKDSSEDAEEGNKGGNEDDDVVADLYDEPADEYFDDDSDDFDRDYTACSLDDCGYCGKCMY